jgi:hypothetical protein
MLADQSLVVFVDDTGHEALVQGHPEWRSLACGAQRATCAGCPLHG